MTMNAEIIAVGTELLMGEVVNSNATYLSKALAEIGVNVYYHATVGDNPERLKKTIQTALSRSNVILFTGGLGPTDDDLTVATLAELMNEPMVSDPVSENQIKAFFITRDMVMSKTNLKQALRPQSAEPIVNRMGTAPGLFWDMSAQVAQKGWGDGTKLIFAFPGVPREMKSMWQEQALPKLLTYLPNPQMLISRHLRFFGIGESMLSEKLRDLMASDSPTVSPYVGNGEVRLRLAQLAGSPEAAMAIIAPMEAKIRERVGQYCYGANETSLEQAVSDLLLSKNKTVAVAESCTGGLVSSRLTDISGSSAYITLNVVTYSNAAKVSQLGVSEATLATHGAVSEACAIEMARGIQKLAGSDYAVSTTGIAGPTGGSEEKPVGLVYIAVAKPDASVVSECYRVNPQYSRQDIKLWFSQYALNALRLAILK